ncbi:zinc ribbon domain-containing protein [Microvirga sp. P5_D2]
MARIPCVIVADDHASNRAAQSPPISVVLPRAIQRCSECGETRRIPRRRGTSPRKILHDEFVCPLCGFAADADVNAARNILALGRQHWAASPDCTDGRSVPACGGLRTSRAREAGTKDRGRQHA